MKRPAKVHFANVQSLAGSNLKPPSYFSAPKAHSAIIARFLECYPESTDRYAGLMSIASRIAAHQNKADLPKFEHESFPFLLFHWGESSQVQRALGAFILGAGGAIHTRVGQPVVICKPSTLAQLQAPPEIPLQEELSLTYGTISDDNLSHAFNVKMGGKSTKHGHSAPYIGLRSTIGLAQSERRELTPSGVYLAKPADNPQAEVVLHEGYVTLRHDQAFYSQKRWIASLAMINGAPDCQYLLDLFDQRREILNS